jgi:methionine-rich copper-binding protein CopC
VSSALVAGGALLCACAAQPAADRAPVQQPAPSILVSSSPAAGSTVSSPVDELVLRFSGPARLVEVTVNGPEGLMPMMVTAAGETDRYSLPLSGLGPGSYAVNWKATSHGTAHRGSFSFTVK